MQNFFITLKKALTNLNVEVVYSPCELDKIKIYSADVNRPGLRHGGDVLFEGGHGK